MAESAIRTVVLAREGAARDRLVEGLVEAGAEVVQTLDPLQVDPAAVDALAPAALVVTLEPAVEDALDAFGPLLFVPGRTVIFEEATLVLQRSGWDAARWVRHLGAKLRGEGSVLPPGAEPADDDVVPDGHARHVPAGPGAGAPESFVFDPVAAEFDDLVLDVPPVAPAFDLDFAFEAIDTGDGASPALADEMPAPGEAASDASVATGDGFDAALLELESTPGPEVARDAAETSLFDPVAAELDDLASDTPRAAPAFDLDFEFELADTDDLTYTPPVADTAPPPGFDVFMPSEASFEAPVDTAGLVSDAAALEATGTDAVVSDPGDAFAGYEVDREDFGLSLVDDAVDAPAVRGAPATPPALDLQDLETRISGLSLADADSYGHGPRRGLVLVEGGLGGPDAVRQLLGAIPDGFPRPILIRLQLDGGRYDRLVRQMERATSLPVQLAEPGMSVAPGEVYFLPPDLLPAMVGGELRFAEGGTLVDLPGAVPAEDSALLFVSGADPSLVDIALGPAWQGALVGGQSDEGCYDSVAAHAVAQGGGPSGRPVEIADWLLARWMPAARQTEPGPGGLSL
ncbi:chemotaxis protein CheB [Luteimonas deserti]|uniref:CheB-type methylesterase domain-containing protein n=1 Tax=Luteimonas deserti TaxID=2752306 RepID=A0A7Z0QQ74_9GAMM|nr:chemotaxis protein CheB [Luteimonas deserti]NYZ61608.1 hypothetical protein [Luteimonas deserti]